MEIKTKTKKWGNSIGIILPKIVVDMKKIKENDELIIEIKNRLTTKDFFGRFPRNSKKTAQDLKNEAREGWE